VKHISPARALARRAVPRAWRPFIRRARWWGLRHRCPICRARLRRYLPEGYPIPVLGELDVVGGEHRLERCCPICNANTRARLVWWYLQSEFRILERPVRLLHLAPELCIYRRLAAVPTVSYCAGDRDPRRYAFARGICGLDATALPYPDARFDLVLANHVLEHVEDDWRALAEIRRVLRPGGIAILQVPVAQRLALTREDPAIVTPEEREDAFGQWDHVRLYGLDYPSRLEKAGFDVRCHTEHAEQGQAFLARWLVDPREVLYVATRPAQARAAPTPRQASEPPRPPAAPRGPR
jgi:SAM-dependent methyltransferase